MRAERRRRLSGPGLRTLLAIARLWGLDAAQVGRVLGSGAEIGGWVAAAAEHRPLDLPEAVLARVGAVLALHQALGELYGDAAAGVAWLRTRRTGPVFGGRTPLDLVTDGTAAGPLAVLNCVRAAQQGHSTGPEALDRAFRPYGVAEIDLS